MMASPIRITPGVSSPDQKRTALQSPLSKPVVVRKDSDMKSPPQSARSPAPRFCSAPTSKAAIQCRRNSVSGSASTISSPMRNSGSSRSRDRVRPRVSPEKVSRDSAKNRKQKMIISPAMPLGACDGPATAEMPEVASVDMAWISASSGGSPAISSKSHSAPVSPT